MADENGLVLVIDDLDDMARTLVMVLEVAGYTCIIGHSGADLTRLLEEHPEVLAVTCDLEMPTEDGIEVHRRLESVLTERRIGFVLIHGRTLPKQDYASEHIRTHPHMRALCKSPFDISEPGRLIEELRTILRPNG